MIQTSYLIDHQSYLHFILIKQKVPVYYLKATLLHQNRQIFKRFSQTMDQYQTIYRIFQGL